MHGAVEIQERAEFWSVTGNRFSWPSASPTTARSGRRLRPSGPWSRPPLMATAKVVFHSASGDTSKARAKRATSSGRHPGAGQQLRDAGFGQLGGLGQPRFVPSAGPQVFEPPPQISGECGPPATGVGSQPRPPARVPEPHPPVGAGREQPFSVPCQRRPRTASGCRRAEAATSSPTPRTIAARPYIAGGQQALAVRKKHGCVDCSSSQNRRSSRPLSRSQIRNDRCRSPVNRMRPWARWRRR